MDVLNHFRAWRTTSCSGKIGQGGWAWSTGARHPPAAPDRDQSAAGADGRRPGRRARLLREARAAAHSIIPPSPPSTKSAKPRPRIRRLAGGADEVIYIAMELVEGEDLGWRLKQGLTCDEALDFAIQIADGSGGRPRRRRHPSRPEASNVRITPQGNVKILDFGLAKVMQEELGDESSGRP